MTTATTFATVEWEIWKQAIRTAKDRRRKEQLIAEAADLFGCSLATIKRRAAR